MVNAWRSFGRRDLLPSRGIRHDAVHRWPFRGYSFAMRLEEDSRGRISELMLSTVV